MIFSFESQIKHLPAFGVSRPIETFKGTVEAENHDEAESLAHARVFTRCRLLEQIYGGTYGFDSQNVRVAFQPNAPKTKSAEEIIDLIKQHLEKAKANTNNALRINRQTQGSGKRYTKSAVDQCAGQQMALTMILNEIELNLEEPNTIIELGPYPRPAEHNRKATQPLGGNHG